MDRRTFLSAVSASVPLALAGCIGGNDDESETTTTPEPTDTTTTTSTDDGPMSFGEAADLSGDRALEVVDSGASAFVVTRGEGADAIHSRADARFVTVKFAPTGITDYRSFVADNVTLTVNGEETFADPIFPIGGGPSRFDAAYAIPRDLTPYTAAVELDAGDTTATWEFDARDIEAVTQSVDFAVGDLEVPDSVAGGDAFTVGVPVENAGDAITFHAVLEGTAKAPVHESADFDAATSETLEFAATAPEQADGASEFEVTVDYGYDSVSTTVAYE